jgi:hypothetical protein
MPKIRDLGINAFPLTMQPPAIGDGGGGQWSDQPDCKKDQVWSDQGNCNREDWSKKPDCANQVWSDQPNCNREDWSKKPDCADQVWSDQPNCDQKDWSGKPNCAPDDCKWSGKPAEECEWSGGPGGKRAGGFTPDAIAQLRQQIANQSATL